jgi:hypothetical protein
MGKLDRAWQFSRKASQFSMRIFPVMSGISAVLVGIRFFFRSIAAASSKPSSWAKPSGKETSSESGRVRGGVSGAPRSERGPQTEFAPQLNPSRGADEGELIFNQALFLVQVQSPGGPVFELFFELM